MPGGFATIDSISNKDDGLDENEDGKGGDGNEYYSGGAGRHGGSGLSVVGPRGRGRGSRHDENGGRGEPVNDIFRFAQNNGGEEAGGNSQEFSHTITMYQSGFTVDNGPYRLLDDPANAPFLENLASGVVPRELEQEIRAGAEPGSFHQVRLVDKRGQEYVPPPQPSYVAFSGEGQTMGGGGIQEGGVVVSSSSTEEAPMPVLDESKPTTMLQIRLKDGRRIKHQFNTSHTLRHIQAVITNEGNGDSSYTLMAGFPPAQIMDYSKTLKEAGLLGAQVVQKPC